MLKIVALVGACALVVQAAFPLQADQKPLAGKFPGATPAETNAAFPGGKEPAKLEAWPKTADGKLETCWKTQVLNDENAGWQANCLGLKKDDVDKTAAACKAACEADPTCPIWQYNEKTGCWHDEGSECTDNVRPKFDAVGSERLLHGGVNIVVKDLTNVEIMNLHAAAHHSVKLADETEAHYHAAEIKHCRNWCWSDIYCQYWQYHPVSGCYVDWNDAKGAIVLPNPMSLENGAKKNTAYVKEVMAGEYIQHFCPPNPVNNVVKVPKPKDDKLWLWITIGLVLLAVIAAAAYFLCKPKPKKTRAIKRPIAPKEPEPVMMYTYAMPQALPTVQTVMPAATYAAPMTTYAAPMTTYAAPQTTYAAAPIATYSSPSTYAPVMTSYSR